MKKEDLLPILELVAPCVSKSDKNPVLKNILINDKIISAYNGTFGIEIQTELDLPDMEIPFDKFYVFVKGAKDELTLGISDNVLNMKSGRSTSKIPIESGEDYPTFDLDDFDFFDISEGFIESVNFCLPFASRKSMQEQLHGVFVCGDGIFATDGQRIAHHSYTGLYSDKNLIIPANFAKIIARYKFDFDQAFYDERKLVLSTDLGDTLITLFGQVIKAEGYPPAQKYMPNVKTFINFPKDELKKGLIKVGDFTGDIQEEAECILKLGDTISVAYKGSTAQITEVFNFGKDYPEGEWLINPYHFSVMLDKCDDFSFVEKKKMNVLYGRSEDKTFECILALQQKKE